MTGANKVLLAATILSLKDNYYCFIAPATMREKNDVPRCGTIGRYANIRSGGAPVDSISAASDLNLSAFIEKFTAQSDRPELKVAKINTCNCYPALNNEVIFCQKILYRACDGLDIVIR